MSAERLEISDLRVTYGAIRALDGVSLKVEPGSVIALLGANGVGKSTLLRAISGVSRVDGGRVKLGDVEITNQAPHTIARLGIAHVPEGRRIVATLTVEENLHVTFGTARRHRKDWPAVRDQIYEVFPILAARRRQPAGVLSGGEQQMLAIGRALVGNPRYLLLDEPSMGLAPVIVDQIYDLLRPGSFVVLNRAVLLAEQSASLGLAVASHAYVLAKGRVLLEGAPAELANHDMVAAYLGGHDTDSPGGER